MIGKRFVLAALAMALGVLLLLPETGMARDRGNGGPAYGWSGYGGRGYGWGYGDGWRGRYFYPGAYARYYYPGRRYYYPGAYSRYYYPGAYGWTSAAPPYLAGQYFVDPADGGFEASEPATDARIHVDVMVPADAQVWFDGDKTQQTGAFRRFVSPPLETGREFTYRIRARWTENGQPVEHTRKIEARAGERVMVDLRTPTDADLPTPRTEDADRGETSRPGDTKAPVFTPPPPTEAPRPPMDSSQPVTKPKSSPPDTSR